MSGLGNLDLSGLGAGLPQGGSGVGGFLSSLLSGFHQEQESRREAQLQQLKVTDIQRSAAQQQYDRYIAAMKANPTMQQDAKMVAQVKRLAQIAGLPDPTMDQAAPASQDTPQTLAGRDNGQPGAASSFNAQIGKHGNKPGEPMVTGNANLTSYGVPALQPETRINMDIAQPKPNINDADDATKERILQAEGADRALLLDKFSGVTDKWLKAPVELTAGSKTAIVKQIGEVVKEIGSANLSGPGAAGILSSLVEDGKQVGWDVDKLANFVKEELTTGPMVQAKLAAMSATLSKTMSQTERQNVLNNYTRMLTIEKPKQIEEQIRHMYNQDQVGAENADSRRETADTGRMREAVYAETAKMNAQSAMERADAMVTNAATNRMNANLNGAKQSWRQLNDTVRSLNDSYREMSKVYVSAANNGTAEDGNTDPNAPDASIGAKYRALRDQLDKANLEQKMTAQFIQDGPQRNYSNGSGQQSTQIVPPGGYDGNQSYRGPIVPYDRGRYQFYLDNGRPSGYLDQENGKSYNMAGQEVKDGRVVAQPTQNGPTQAQPAQPTQGQGQQSTSQQQPPVNGQKTQSSDPNAHPGSKMIDMPKIGTGKNEMRPGTMETFLSMPKTERIAQMQDPRFLKLPINVQAFLRAHVNDSQPHTLAGAEPDSPVKPTQDDPWAKIDSLTGQPQQTSPHMGAGAKELADMVKQGQQNTLGGGELGGGEPNVFEQAGKGIGAVTSAIGGTVKGIEDRWAQMGKQHSNVQAPQAELHQRIVQQAVPILQEELRAGKPLTQILMEMAQHGIDHDTAMEALHHIYKNFSQDSRRDASGHRKRDGGHEAEL